MIPELLLDCSRDFGVLHPKWGKEPDGVVDDLDPTEDGEASEEAHRSPDEAKLGFHCHLQIMKKIIVS